ncbi:hypothetical protein N7471_001034 [Penicillium samsonianum]|uniref:uncharacterized protein n=1 Tax=Penicillium samsonianum TaxID=1882272 RepID=UPI0025484CF7|nr:uncharacterized protein N7471_001034 [Penicillium samsonianum]KAJ6149835.1 hypothetical protein N7471_001034 [Penicillium samsonianum]
MALKSQKARQKIHFMRFGSWAIILHQLLVAKSSGALRTPKRNIEEKPHEANMPAKKRGVLGELDSIIASMERNVCCQRETFEAEKEQLRKIKAHRQ